MLFLIWLDYKAFMFLFDSSLPWASSVTLSQWSSATGFCLSPPPPFSLSADVPSIPPLSCSVCLPGTIQIPPIYWAPPVSKMTVYPSVYMLANCACKHIHILISLPSLFCLPRPFFFKTQTCSCARWGGGRWEATRWSTGRGGRGSEAPFHPEAGWLEGAGWVGSWWRRGLGGWVVALRSARCGTARPWDTPFEPNA